MVLVLGQARRFSVDVDLVTQVELAAIDAALTWVCAQPPFRSFAYDATRSHKDDVPRGHYYVFYDSALDQLLLAEHPQRSIAIDLLFEEHNYPQVLQLPVASTFLHQAGEPLHVATPSVESIAGDKLTAFAPRTTGILYGQGKELEIKNFIFELPIPLHQRDVAEGIYEDSSFRWYTRPPLFFVKPSDALLDGYRREVKNMSSNEAKREQEFMTFNMAVDALRNTVVFDSSTGETKATNGVLPDDRVGLYIVRGDEQPTFP